MVLLAGFSVIVDHAPIVFGVLLLIILCQILLSLTLRFLFGDQLTASDYLILGLAGWLLPASLISVIWFFFGSGLVLAILILSILIIFFYLRLKPDLAADSKTTSLILLIFIALAILIRLAFVSKAVLPSYFDSAQHYLFTKNLLTQHAALLAGYYHLGFHMLTAFIVSVSHANIAQTMLVLGQLILALMSIPVFFLIKYFTKSTLAGFTALSLAAFGWYMPAHAMDWGKYPALTGVALIPFTLCLMVLIMQNRKMLPAGKLWARVILLGVSMVISEFAHSRTLIIYGIVLLAWLISFGVQRLAWQGRLFVVGLVMLAIVWEVIYIQGEPVLGPLFDPYLNKGPWITVIALLLSVFALKDYSQPILIALLAIGFMLGSLFIPVANVIPGFSNLTLLDRPFVEMILYLPLAVLGGLGFAGLESYLRNQKIKVGAVLLLAAIVIGHTLISYDLYPADCCVIAGNDDVTALDWMDKHLPSDALIGIATTTLNVLPTDSFEGYVGSDAGIWITPLIDRSTRVVQYDSDFDQPATLNVLCEANVNYLYVGELGQTFDTAKLNNHPDWYKMLLAMPKASVYEVVGCR